MVQKYDVILLEADVVRWALWAAAFYCLKTQPLPPRRGHTVEGILKLFSQPGYDQPAQNALILVIFTLGLPGFVEECISLNQIIR